MTDKERVMEQYIDRNGLRHDNRRDAGIEYLYVHRLGDEPPHTIFVGPGGAVTVAQIRSLHAFAESAHEYPWEEGWRVDSENVYLCPRCQDDEEREHWPDVEAEGATCEGCGRINGREEDE